MILHRHTNNRTCESPCACKSSCALQHHVHGRMHKKTVMGILLCLLLFNILSSSPDNGVEAKFIKLTNYTKLWRPGYSICRKRPESKMVLKNWRFVWGRGRRNFSSCATCKWKNTEVIITGEMAVM